MSGQPKDGGPAFPIVETADSSVCVGMSLRDYFAAKALPKILEQYPSDSWEINAEYAFKAADAMLKERAK